MRKSRNVFKLAMLVLATSLALTAYLGIGPSSAIAAGGGGHGGGGGRDNCWMTGGGSIFEVDYAGEFDRALRITHGFVLHCVPRNSDNLQINDHGPGGWSFHLENLVQAICIDDPAIEPNPPDATFDTFVGEGTGRCKNTGGEERDCTAYWTFTDGGERGGCLRDTAIITVEDVGGNVLISVSGDVDCGNHQAHSQ